MKTLFAIALLTFAAPNVCEAEEAPIPVKNPQGRNFPPYAQTQSITVFSKSGWYLRLSRSGGGSISYAIGGGQLRIPKGTYDFRKAYDDLFNLDYDATSIQTAASVHFGWRQLPEGRRVWPSLHTTKTNSLLKLFETARQATGDFSSNQKARFLKEWPPFEFRSDNPKKPNQEIDRPSQEPTPHLQIEPQN